MIYTHVDVYVDVCIYIYTIIYMYVFVSISLLYLYIYIYLYMLCSYIYMYILWIWILAIFIVFFWGRRRWAMRNLAIFETTPSSNGECVLRRFPSKEATWGKLILDRWMHRNFCWDIIWLGSSHVWCVSIWDAKHTSGISPWNGTVPTD